MIFAMINIYEIPHNNINRNICTFMSMGNYCYHIYFVYLKFKVSVVFKNYTVLISYKNNFFVLIMFIYDPW
jgi:hypothetical protein